MSTLSIKLSPQYSALRICAQTCVDRGNDNSDLEGHLECGDSKILNACYCREDLQPKATKFLSSCIVTRCGYNNQDVTSAWRLYEGYCSTATRITTTKSTSTKTTSTGAATQPPTTSPIETPAPSTPTPTLATPSSTASSDTPTATPQTDTSLLPGSTVTAITTSITNNTFNNTTTTTTARTISPGAIAGIVLGGIATVILGIALLIWVYRRRQKDTQRSTGGGQFGGHFGTQEDVYSSGAGFDRKPATSRSVESFDLGTMAMKAEARSSRTDDTYPLVQGPVEICDTGPVFRAELSAGDDVAYRKEKG
ncbi:hypothetical protein QBC34DRAFT_164830 [Podospora aff. communis PSN243]|uniref:Extracellular membrane protein CFEM domain-containing protein n=1 Tax=Podospora aff. communis PSN243 TaxID=3040156 RepID=A0AAV9GAD5_9PEZI|nr:hypothetical protein QBC34DRAFT_164830 [Podospora aff. communis PSN243]